MDIYYAHSKKDRPKYEWQSCDEHDYNVKHLAGNFADTFGAKKLGEALGDCHDVGKRHKDFQVRLEGCRISYDHPIVSAIAFTNQYGYCGRILSYPIAGHHGGLENYGSTESGLKQRIMKGKKIYDNFDKSEIKLPDVLPAWNDVISKLKFTNGVSFSVSFLIHMLFSCLVDADFLDTEKVIQPDKANLRGSYDTFDVLSERYNKFIENNFSNVPDTYTNRIRRSVLNQCINKAVLPRGILELTAPTGSGKTISLIGFSINHLIAHNMQRIICVQPYTTIIEQTADVYRSIFGEQNVLEHHSNYDPKNNIYEDTAEKLKLSSENWDAPIIVTTNVQFFESLYSNKVSMCRKLHNLANSIIILDEAQLVPTDFLKPCLSILTELVINYGVTIVICTATQPNLHTLLDPSVKPTKLVDSVQMMHEAAKRIKVTKLGNISDLELSSKLKSHKQVLCIVDTKKHAKHLYKLMKNTKNCFHYSAKMCPENRRDKLKEICKLLDDGEECRVISTDAIKVGVDISFPVGYFSMGGIADLIQGAGRVDREGELGYAEIYVFTSTEEYVHSTRQQKRCAELGNMVFDEFPENPFSVEAIEKYYNLLYFYLDEALDKNDILKLLNVDNFEYPFEDVADKFNLIGNYTKSIIIPYNDEAIGIIKKLEYVKSPWKYIRKLQKYTVNVYPSEFEELIKSKIITLVNDRFYILSDIHYYSKDIGLMVDESVSDELLII
jgi:CRISPR-associated endonuclease/helicase Cas3